MARWELWRERRLGRAIAKYGGALSQAPRCGVFSAQMLKIEIYI
jgi:hypothetical protein